MEYGLLVALCVAVFLIVATQFGDLTGRVFEKHACDEANGFECDPPPSTPPISTPLAP